MNENNQLTLKHILESPAPKDTSLFWTAASADQEIFGKLQNGYNACMNETLLASIGSKPLLDLLLKLDKIYATENPKTSKKDDSLTKAVEYLMEIGIEGPVSIDVGADDKDPDINIVSVGAPYSFGLPSKQYYERAEIVASYKETIGTVLEALLKEANPGTFAFMFEGDNQSSPLSKDLVDSLVAFEKSLANAAPDPEDASDVTKYYNPRTLKEAEAYNSEISLKHILDIFASDYTPSKISQETFQDPQIVVKKHNQNLLGLEGRAIVGWSCRGPSCATTSALQKQAARKSSRCQARTLENMREYGW
jgi:endothelin-converting enzyme